MYVGHLVNLTLVNASFSFGRHRVPKFCSSDQVAFLFPRFRGNDVHRLPSWKATILVLLSTRPTVSVNWWLSIFRFQFLFLLLEGRSSVSFIVKSPVIYFRFFFSVRSEPFYRNFVIEDKELELADSPKTRTGERGPCFWSLIFFYGAGLGHGLLGRTLHHRRGREFAKFLVDGYPIVIQSRRLQDYTRGAYQHRQGKNPKKQSI